MGAPIYGPSWAMMVQDIERMRPGSIIRVRDPRAVFPLPRLESGYGNCGYCGRKRRSDDLKKCESCGAPPR